MNKKIILEAAAIIAVAASVVAVPMVAGSAPKTTCETSTTVGSGRPLSECPPEFRTGDRRQVTP